MAKTETTETTMAEAPPGAGQEKAFPPLDPSTFAPQLIWLAITFAVLYVIMSRVALPKIGTVIEERRDRIAGDLDQAEQLKKKTEAAIASYEQALAEARAKAHAIAQEARDKLNADMDAERASVDKEIAAKTAEAEARIAASKEQALAHVNEVAVDTASAIVTALIGGKVTKKEAAEAVGALGTG